MGLLFIYISPGKLQEDRAPQRRRMNIMKSSKKMAIRSGLVVAFLRVFTGAMVATEAAAGSLPAPNWAAIFSPNGTVINLQGGLDAIFLEDKISADVGVDMTVLADPSDPSLLDNSAVASAHDVGNGYVWVTTDAAGNQLLYAGVERLGSALDTYVEFEFNQAVVHVRSGAPWPIYGESTVDDLLVRVNFTAGQISSTEFMRWDGADYQLIATAGPNGCAAGDYRACAGSPPMQSAQAQVWDAAYQLVPVPQPDSFIEIGVNVTSLLGSNIEFTSIQVRTPQDIILNAFRRIGSAAHRAAGDANNG